MRLFLLYACACAVMSAWGILHDNFRIVYYDADCIEYVNEAQSLEEYGGSSEDGEATSNTELYFEAVEKYIECVVSRASYEDSEPF